MQWRLVDGILYLLCNLEFTEDSPVFYFTFKCTAAIWGMYYHGNVTCGEMKAQRQQCHPATRCSVVPARVEVLQLRWKSLHGSHFYAYKWVLLRGTWVGYFFTSPVLPPTSFSHSYTSGALKSVERFMNHPHCMENEARPSVIQVQGDPQMCVPGKSAQIVLDFKI